MRPIGNSICMQPSSWWHGLQWWTSVSGTTESRHSGMFFTMYSNVIDYMLFQGFVETLSSEDLKRLTVELLTGRGGVSMAKCLLDRGLESDPFPLGEQYVKPRWCICSRCFEMDNPEVENVCCGRVTCITLYEHFFNICIDQQVLTVAIHQRADIRADPISYSPESFRKAAYRQYVLWIYKKLGRGRRKVLPSCVVRCIRRWYPSPAGIYMRYRDF